MSDTTHPEAPSSEVSSASAHTTGGPSEGHATAPTNTQSEMGEIPEEILDEWRWILKGREEGFFDEYPGKHVAVYQQKIWGSSYDPELLREYLALKHHIDPARFIMVYIDRW